MGERAPSTPQGGVAVLGRARTSREFARPLARGSAGASPHCCEHVGHPCSYLRRKVGECQTAWNSAQLHRGFEKSRTNRMATKERKGTQKGRQKARTVRGAGHRELFRHHFQRASSGRKASVFASFAFFCGHPPRWSGQLNHVHSSGPALRRVCASGKSGGRVGNLACPSVVRENAHSGRCDRQD